MAKIDWSKAKPYRETESIYGENLDPAPPFRKTQTKESLRVSTESAVDKFLRRGGKVGRARQGRRTIDAYAYHGR